MNASPQSFPQGAERGFSLVEIMIALGIFSFAAVAILGLLPLALHLARESQNETRAAHIANQIFSDLRSSPPSLALIAVGSPVSLPASFLQRNLATAWTEAVYYDVDGRPVGAASHPSLAAKNPEAAFVVSISTAPDQPVIGLTQAQVDVAAPAQATSARRTTNTFLTILEP